MSTPIITETVRLPGNVNAKDARGYVICRGATSGPDGAYATRSGLTVAGRIPVTFAAAGFEGQLRARDGGALQLNPNQDSGSNDAITSPTGSFYEYRITIPGQQDWVRYLSVPDAAGPYRIDQILTVNPAAVAPMSASSVTVTPRASMLLDDTQLQAFIDEGALEAMNQAAYLPARRGWAQFKRSGTAMNMPCFGDSVTNGQVTSDLWWQQVVRKVLKEKANLPAGGPGWRYASSNVDTARTPTWTQSGGAAWQVDGLANASVTIPYGGQVQLSVPTTLDRVIPVFIRSGDPNVSIARIVDSGLGGTLSGAGFDLYDASLGFPAPFIPLTPRVYDRWFDSGSAMGASASRTITISCEPHATRRNGCIFVGAWLLNGEGAGDFLIADAGINGATTATFLNGSAHHEAFSAASGRKSTIEYWELGLNETDPATYQAGLISIWNTRKAMHPANQAPTIAAITSWPKTGRTPAQNTPYLRAAINAALTVGGVAVIRGHDILGDFSSNSWGLSPDGVHPGADAQFMLGHVVAYETARYMGIS